MSGEDLYPSASDLSACDVRWCPCQRRIRYRGGSLSQWLNRNHCSVGCLIRFTPDRQISALVGDGVCINSIAFALGFSRWSIYKVLASE